MPSRLIKVDCVICGDSVTVTGRWSPPGMEMERPAFPHGWLVLVRDGRVSYDVCPKHAVKIDDEIFPNRLPWPG